MFGLVAILACSTGVTNLPGEPTEPATSSPVDLGPLALEVTGPTAGAFVGDRVAVAGRVNDPDAIVWIEGYRANVGAEGHFSVQVPVDGDFRVIDVEAARPRTEEHLRERIAVFGGADPLASWPGGMGVRATPVALDHVAEILQGELEALDLPGQLEALAPELAFGDTVLAPVGVVAPRPTVTLVSSASGLAIDAALGRIEVLYEVTAPWLGTIDVVLGIDGAGLGGQATLAVDADGNLSLAVSDTRVVLGAPVFEVGGIDPEVLEQVAGNLTAGLAGILEGVLDAAVGGFAAVTIPLGELSLDALGVPLSLRVAELGTDDAGIAALLDVDLGVPAVGAARVPDLVAAGPQADVALTVHEGLVQGLLDTDLLELLDLDLDLPGLLGEILVLPLAALPGGDQLPSERAGACISLAPGELGVARLRPGLAPLAVVTLPDVHVAVGLMAEARGSCEPWLEASLAVQASFDAEGSVLSTRLEVVDGAVLSYAAEGEFPEDEIVAGLGGLVGVASDLLGGAGLEIDLADLLGGVDPETLPLGELSPRLLDATPARGADGAVLPGSVVVAVSLWD